jgi:hypothetical protein
LTQAAAVHSPKAAQHTTPAAQHSSSSRTWGQHSGGQGACSFRAAAPVAGRNREACAAVAAAAGCVCGASCS